MPKKCTNALHLGSRRQEVEIVEMDIKTETHPLQVPREEAGLFGCKPPLDKSVGYQLDRPAFHHDTN